MTLSIMAAVAGCVAPAEVPNARAVLATDEFSTTLDVVGPMMIDNPFFGIKDNFRLVTHIDKQTHAVAHVIEVEIDHEGDFFKFRYAADDTGTALPLVPISREHNVFGVDRTELLNVIVPESALRAHVASGYRVRLSARDGTYYTIAVTPAMIAAQFDEVAQVQGTTSALGLAQSLASGAPAPAVNATTPSGKPLLGIAPFDLPFGAGVQVNRVDPNTPAAAAGFAVGDLVVSYNGQPVTDAQHLRDLIGQTRSGTLVPIEIKRNGQAMTLSTQM
jgi:hypothetical protein